MTKENRERTEKAIITIRDALLNDIVFPSIEEQSALNCEMEDIFQALHNLKYSIIALEQAFGGVLSTYGIADELAQLDLLDNEYHPHK